MGSLSESTASTFLDFCFPSATVDHGTVTHVSIETVTLTTIDGVDIVADIAPAAVEVPVRGAVVLAHPHPLHGGDRHNPIIDRLFRALPSIGLHTLRLDFRGGGESGGEHDGGDAERLDVAAGIDFVSGLGVDEVWLVGYSFGALVSLNVIEPRVEGWIAIAPPLSGRELAGRDPRPTLLLAPAHDQFCPPATVQERVTGWSNTDVESIDGTDHFLNGRLDEIVRRIAERLEVR